MDYNVDCEELYDTSLKLKRIVDQAMNNGGLSEDDLDAFYSITMQMYLPGEYGDNFRANVNGAMNKVRSNISNERNFEILYKIADFPKKIADIMSQSDMNTADMIRRSR